MNQFLDFKNEGEKLLPFLTKIRRHIHANPEIGKDQPETVAFLVEQLKDFGLNLRHGVSEVGLVFDIKGDHPGPLIGLRGDMDALGMAETDDPEHLPNKLGFRSKNPGFMHACGHDAHTAILLGAAKVIHANRNKLRGTVRFLFQPGEEGHGGARRMIEARYLEGLKNVFALHCFPFLKTGQIGFRKGPILSAVDLFKIIVTGKGGHGSAPEYASDQILAAAKIINDLQMVISRRKSAFEPVVLTIGYIHGGVETSPNVIPQKIEFSGTLRTFSPLVRASSKKLIEEIAELGAKTVHQDAKAKVAFPFECPSTINDEKVIDRLIPLFQKFFSPENLFPEIKPIMGSEDFSAMLEKVPGAFMFLGVTGPNKDPEKSPLFHNPGFDIDENSLSFGVRVFSNLVFNFPHGDFS